MSEVYVLLNNIRSLHNVGSIFRTSDAAGVKKIFICGETGTPPRSQIRKVALGAEDMVEWEYFKDAHECLDQLKAKGVEVVALELTDKSVDYKDYKPNKPVCLMLGHEVYGVSPTLIQKADVLIKIPMLGKKESLNVSVAFGIAVYQLISR